MKKNCFLALIVAGALLSPDLSLAGGSALGGRDWGMAEDSGAGFFLLLSDLHFDPFSNSNLQAVKRLIAEPVEEWEGILKPAIHDPLAPYGKDPNYSLMASALAEAAHRGPYGFALVTGDYLVHDSRKLFEAVGGKDEQAYEDFVTKTEVFVAREVQKVLGNTPVYFCLGNNDSECGDYMLAGGTPFLKALSVEWKTLADHPDAQKSMADAGYYELPHPTLEKTDLVVLNDVYWSNHFEEDSCHSQPNARSGDREMDWLQARLKEAKSQGRQVQLVMHIPPQVDIFGTLKAVTTGAGEKGGKLFWDEKYEKAYTRLMEEYKDTVQIAFAGHTHMDDFRIQKDGQGKGFLVTHITPAVSPIRGNNPGFQVMEYRKSTGEIQDMATFYLKDDGAKDVRWAMEYDFDRVYGLDGYDVQSLEKLTRAIDEDAARRALFAGYYCLSASEVVTEDAWKRLNDLRTAVSQKELDAALR